jgi:hypothetical protein
MLLLMKLQSEIIPMFMVTVLLLFEALGRAISEAASSPIGSLADNDGGIIVVNVMTIHVY